MEKRCRLKAIIFFLVLGGWFGAIVLFSLLFGTSDLQETFLTRDATPFKSVDCVDGPPTGSSLSMLAENQSSADCCPSSYSTSKGCVCLTQTQLELLRNRGGNRT